MYCVLSFSGSKQIEIEQKNLSKQISGYYEYNVTCGLFWWEKLENTDHDLSLDHVNFLSFWFVIHTFKPPSSLPCICLAKFSSNGYKSFSPVAI